MTEIARIVSMIETKYEIKVHGSSQQRTSIYGMRFFNDNDANIEHLPPNILYLAEFDKYGKLDIYGDVLFVGCGDETPSSESLYIEENINLIDLYNTLEDIILANHQMSIKRQKLFSILHSGQGLDALLKAAYQYIGNTIVICDSSYGILASFPRLSQDENLEIRKNRLSLKEEYSEDMEIKMITERIYHSVYPFAFKFDNSPYYWIFESIRIKRAVVGYVCVKCNEREHTENDLEIIHAIAQLTSIQFQKDDSYRNPQGIKYDMFLRELFSRNYTEPLALEHLTRLGVRPKKYYFIIACCFSSDSERLMNYHYYIQQLSTILINSITGIFGNRFVTLVSTSDMYPLNSGTKNRLTTFLTMNNMVGCVSYPFDSLTESSAYYTQCQGVLSHWINEPGDSHLIFYDDFYLKHLLRYNHKQPIVEASIHPSVKFMKKYDDENGTVYTNTLKAYFNNNRSASATANALFIHKSTLFYRLDKMKQLFNLELDNKDALFAYEYSLKLMD